MSQAVVINHNSNAAITATLWSNDQTVALLTFKVAGQRHGLLVADVVRIIEMVAITPLAAAPDIIQGVINLHGKVVPVMDLHQRFGLPAPDYGLHTPIILVNAGQTQIMGLIVEAVEQVLEVSAGEIEPVDSIVSAELAERMAVNSVYLIGIAKINRQLISILNVQRLLRSTEQAELSQLLSDGN